MEELSFSEWLKVFLEEKGLSETVIEFENKHYWHFMPISVIQEFLASCSEQDQQKIKSKFVELDFCNMSIAHFLEYIARIIVMDLPQGFW